MKIKITENAFYNISKKGAVTYTSYLLGELVVSRDCGTIGSKGLKALQLVDCNKFNLLAQLKWFELQGQTFNPNIQGSDRVMSESEVAPSIIELREAQKKK